MLLKKARKSQAAIDLISSYGVAIIIMTIAIAVLYKTSVLSPSLAGSSCTGVQGFSCDAFAINAVTGVLTVSLSQATGGPIYVNGAACSSLGSGTGSGPQFGNLGVTGNSLYYPNGNWLNGGAVNTIYSGSNATMMVKCFSSASGSAAAGSVGNSFLGYLWLNYTVPSYGNTIQQVASMSLIYS